MECTTQEKARKAANQQEQLDSTNKQLHDRIEELRELRAQMRCIKFRSAEDSKASQLRICDLGSQLADAQRQISLTCCKQSRKVPSAAAKEGCMSLRDSTLAQQLQEACAQANDATKQLQAREHDIKVMQDCLEAERKDKEGVQKTLHSILTLHNQLHVHLAQVGSQA